MGTCSIDGVAEGLAVEVLCDLRGKRQRRIELIQGKRVFGVNQIVEFHGDSEVPDGDLDDGCHMQYLELPHRTSVVGSIAEYGNRTKVETRHVGQSAHSCRP